MRAKTFRIGALCLGLAALSPVPGHTDTSDGINYFSYQQVLQSRTTLQLGVVRAEAAGVVRVYDFHRGVRGDVLGETRVRAGANGDVRVTTPSPARRDVLAVLIVDGQEVAQRDFRVSETPHLLFPFLFD